MARPGGASGRRCLPVVAVPGQSPSEEAPVRYTLQARLQHAFAHRLVAAARLAWTRYWTRRAARATVGILQRLDDRALKDIGLNRSEIDRVANGDCRRASACHT